MPEGSAGEAPWIAPLRASDVGDAVRLSDGASWNQTAADWRRLLDLQPDGVWGAWDGDRLVGSATFVAYPPSRGEAGRPGPAGEVHWIGMVLVLPDARGRGIGRAIFDHVLAASAAREPHCVGLDATDLGVGLYRRQGFVAVRPIERWSGVLRQRPAAGPAVPLREEHLAAVARLDEAAVGVDRGPLLRHLFADEGVRGWIVQGDEGPEGYAFLRPGRTQRHLGPAVAEGDDAYAALLAAAADALSGEPVFLDAACDGATSAAHEGAGLEVARRLTRMTWGRAMDVLTGRGVRLAAGFEWG